jgi:uncharacterized membrane protein
VGTHFSWAVLVHLIAATSAVGIGAGVLAMRKGTRVHRWAGRAWVGVMIVVAVGSFWLRHDGTLSWIHGLSAFTLASLTVAVWAIRKGKVRTHRAAMIGTFSGLVIAGLFALSPGRLLGSLLIGW